MNKKIEFEKNGEKFTLEYNREAIAYIESQGFDISEMTSKPMMMLPLAFSGLFYKNHKRTRQSFINECYDNFSDKSKLIEVIGEMLAEAYNSLVEDSQDKKGNLEWKVVG